MSKRPEVAVPRPAGSSENDAKPDSPETAADLPPRAPNVDPASEAFAIEAARLLSDDKCDQVVVLDVRAVSSITNYLVIASGTSDRQMASALDHAAELGAGSATPMLRSTADERSTWLVADFGNVMMHLFEPNARAHYDLEMLWGDVPRLSWERPDQLRRDWAGLKR